MNDLLTQLILAQRNEDVEKWMNILFVVVLAVFWALGGILKARSNKSQSRKSGRQSPRRPPTRPPAQSRATGERAVRPPQRPAVRREPPPHRPARTRLDEWRAAARKLAAEAEQALRVQTQQPPKTPDHPVPGPQSPPPLADALAYPKTPSAPRSTVRLSPRDEKVQSPYLPGLLSDYTDPDQLRRAILHYEILGKPLALREPPDSLIGP